MNADKNTSIVKIYELRDPRIVETKYAESTKYIGMTLQSLEKRFNSHIQQARAAEVKNKTVYSQRWILSLLSKGLKPTIHLIEEVVGLDSGFEVEQYWIKEFKEYGCVLTNLTDGGAGAYRLNRSKGWCENLSKRNVVMWNNHEFNNVLTAPVYQFTMNGELLAKHDYVSKAARAVNLHTSLIFSNLKGRTKHAGGFIFSFLDHLDNVPSKYRHSLGVDQYDLENNFVRHWNSVKEACSFYGGSSHLLDGFLNKKVDKKRQSIWKYTEN